MTIMGLGLWMGAGEGGVAAPVAPVITQTTVAGNNPMQWDSAYTDLIIGTDYIRCRWRIDAGAWTYETDVLFDSAFYLDYGLDGVAYPWPLFTAEPFTTGQVVDVQEGILRGGTTVWSNTLTDTMAAGASYPIPSTGLAAYFLASDLASMSQTITGTTDVTADGDRVGTWRDQTAAAFDMEGLANDTTRPIYDVTGGVHSVVFDGVDDVLKRDAALDLFNAGSYTIAVALKGNPGLDKYLFGEGSSSNNNTIFGPLRSDLAVASTQYMFYRSDAGVNVLNNTGKTGAYDNSYRVVLLTDNGASVVPYVDGVAGTTRTYSRTEAFTPNRTAIASLRRATSSSWFNCEIQALAIWEGVVLDATDRATVNTYFGSLQGRSI